MYTYEQIISDLNKKIYKPIYFLMGEEGYFIDEITSLIEKKILTEDEKTFNQTIYYGKDIDLATLINSAKQLPMGANYNVVIIKEAQNIKGIEGTSTSYTKTSKTQGKTIAKDPFLSYIENPVESTILVINLRGKTLDKRKKIYKTLDKNACLFASDKIYENKVGAWIINYLNNKGYKINTKDAELIASFTGNDLSKVANEVNKLILSEPENKTITTKIIEENIGISKEFNVFELQNAIGKRNLTQSMFIAINMSKNPKTKSIIPIISILYSYFTKLLKVHYSDDKSQQVLAAELGVHPFFVKDYLTATRHFSKGEIVQAISILRQYDAYSKGIESSTIEDEELLKEMVFALTTI